MLAPCATRSASANRRRDELVAQPVDDGDAPDHLVAIGNPVDRADPARLLVEDGQVLRAAGEVAEERQRIVAGDGEARLDRSGTSVSRPPSDVGEHRRAPSDRLGQHRVVAGLVGEQRLEPLGLFRRQALQELLRRALVRLGEENVEGDRGSALGRELLDQPGDGGAWPWPLPDPRERFLVDVDDAHRQRRIVGLRLEPLIRIEGDQPERLEEEGVGDAQSGRAGEHRKDEEEVAPARPDGHFPAVSRRPACLGDPA